MRPQRCRAASTIAASVASLVTSASNATHSPPDCRAMATVSSAEDGLLSTASTLAPSCAKRSTVARPLPMPSPGDWPAPTTIAILSLRRMVSSTAMMPPAAYGNSPTGWRPSIVRGDWGRRTLRLTRYDRRMTAEQTEYPALLFTKDQYRRLAVSYGCRRRWLGHSQWRRTAHARCRTHFEKLRLHGGGGRCIVPNRARQLYRGHRPLGGRKVHAFARDQSPHRPEQGADLLRRDQYHRTSWGGAAAMARPGRNDFSAVQSGGPP